MANTFLLAQGKAVGKSLAEPDRLDDARRILATAAANGVRVVLPIDVIVATAAHRSRIALREIFMGPFRYRRQWWERQTSIAI